jgi:signal transduction histidine kinase
MSRATKSPRVFQLTTLLMVLIAGVQVGWWMYDQRSVAIRHARQSLHLYSQEVAAAQALLDAGRPAEQVRTLLPRVNVNGRQASLDPVVSSEITDEQVSRINQYLWESGFFLLALGLCIGVIWRALRNERLVLQEQDHFLALVSHQFKTPLASLQLSLETMALRSLTPAETRTLVERMLADITRMETMVTRILDSVRLERGRVTMRPEPIDLAAAVARVVGQFEERARADRITLGAQVPAGLEVLADPLAVDVVMRNLIENAIAAVAPLGGGTIELTARRLDGEVELAVRDSGVGFKPADSAELFKKFSRLHPGTGSTHHGTGLGLFIVQRMMQLAGGRVSAHSDGEGHGAQFVLAWPVAPAERT